MEADGIKLPFLASSYPSPSGIRSEGPVPNAAVAINGDRATTARRLSEPLGLKVKFIKARPLCLFDGSC